MSLHHIVSIYLFGGCYLTNALECGMVVAFLHDIADITTNVVKFFSESIYPNICAVFFATHMLIWGWTRNIVLPFESIYYIYLYCPTFGVEKGDVGIVCKPMFIYLLSCMCLLHYYWYAMFIRMMRKFVLKYITDKS